MNSPLPLPIIHMKNYLFMLIIQQVSSVPASTTLFLHAELISESLGWVEGDAAAAEPIPRAQGILHPAQVPARPAASSTSLALRSLCSVLGYLSQYKLSWDWDCLDVREVRNGAEMFPWFFVTGVLNTGRSRHDAPVQRSEWLDAG